MVIHLTGADSYRSAKRLAELRSAFVQKHDPRGFNTVTLDGATVTAEAIRNAIQATGFFAAKRFVVIDDYRPDGLVSQIVLAEILLPVTKSTSDVIVVIRDTLTDGAAVPAKRTTSKAGVKKPSAKKVSSGPFTLPDAKREAFSQLSPTQAEQWLIKEAKTQNGILEPQAAARLVAMCAGDSWRMANELEKLLMFCGDAAVTVPDVESMVRSEYASDIFALTDALGQRQSARAMELLHHELVSGANAFGLIATLASHIRNLYQVKQSRDNGTAPGSIASELALHPFVVQKALTQSTKFTIDELRNLHHRLLTIDHDLKTSPLDAETLLDMLVVRS